MAVRAIDLIALLLAISLIKNILTIKNLLPITLLAFHRGQLIPKPLANTAFLDSFDFNRLVYKWLVPQFK